MARPRGNDTPSYRCPRPPARRSEPRAAGRIAAGRPTERDSATIRRPVPEPGVMKPSIVAALFAACAALAGVAPAQSQEVRKILHVKVGIDAQGRVVAADMVENRVPAAIASAMLARARGWTFTPVTADGVAVPAVTYAS